jgi:L-alanine-DL-glutamate epimerase-like enolase superfamily enzyme
VAGGVLTSNRERTILARRVNSWTRPRLMPDSTDRISEISFYRLDLELARTFVVATGSLDSAQVVAVRLRLESGHEGWGEMAPFPAITGETREGSLADAQGAVDGLLGARPVEYRRLFAQLLDRLPASPAARCGLETAILDAFSTSLGIPLWALLGGAELAGPHVTDITIPVTDLDTTVQLARDWYRRGFRRFKLKVGVDADLELEKLRRLAADNAAVQFILDANGGYSLSEARRFLAGLRPEGPEVLLLEQPLAPEDLEGAVALCREFRVPIAADESARNVADVVALARSGAAHVINLKIMKTGLRECIRMAIVARALGLRLMIGGMLETRLAMGCSLALVLGLGGFDFLDLDTPLLLRSDPWTGGFGYRGQELLPWHEPGLGMRPAPGPTFSPC